VAIVDREMSAIRDAGKVKARERIAVLAALNLAYQRAEQAQAGGPHAAPVPQPAPPSSEALNGIDVDALVRRMDAALGHDGQLL
jgi:cell division protein ZapA